MADGRLTYADIRTLLQQMYEQQRTSPNHVRLQIYLVDCPHCQHHLATRALWYADWMCMQCGWTFWQDRTIAFTPEQDIIDVKGVRSEFLMDVRQAIIEGKAKQILVPDYS
jgi:ribosomal protein L37AE/L43A